MGTWIAVATAAGGAGLVAFAMFWLARRLSSFADKALEEGIRRERCEGVVKEYQIELKRHREAVKNAESARGDAEEANESLRERIHSLHEEVAQCGDPDTVDRVVRERLQELTGRGTGGAD